MLHNKKIRFDTLGTTNISYNERSYKKICSAMKKYMDADFRRKKTDSLTDGRRESGSEAYLLNLLEIEIRAVGSPGLRPEYIPDRIHTAVDLDRR